MRVNSYAAPDRSLTGEEKVLGVQDGETVAIPVNMIAGEGLPAAGGIGGSEEVLLIQAGQTRRVPFSSVASAITGPLEAPLESLVASAAADAVSSQAAAGQAAASALQSQASQLAVAAALAAAGPVSELPMPAATRTILSALPKTGAAILFESGHEGIFVWTGGDLSAKVLIDSDQGLYVPPSSDTTGASGAWVRSFNGPSYMTWFGWKGDGTVNPAAAFARAQALVPNARGDQIHFPRGRVVIDGPLIVNRVMTLMGYGSGSSSSIFDSATRIEHPAGTSAFLFLANGPNGIQGAQGAKIRDLSTYQPTRLNTSATANYTAGSRAITITAGTNDYVPNQVIELVGAGPVMTSVDKVAAMTSGSNIATVTGGTGNAGVLTGQPITIPGAGGGGADLVGFVGAWSSTTVTVVNAAGAALNAGSTVSGKAYSITWPLIARIESVSDNTITLAQAWSDSTTVVGAKLAHCDAGIYTEVVVQGSDVECVGAHAAVVGEGNSGSGAGFNTDHTSFDKSILAGYKYGVITLGYDGQIWKLDKCNMAGPAVSLLDMSLIGCWTIGCHFAFNLSVVVPLPSATPAMALNYFEGGTSWWGNGKCYAFGCIGFDNANGWFHQGAAFNAAYGNSPPIIADNITVLGTKGGNSGGLRVAGPAYFNDISYRLRIENGSAGRPFGATGIGLELYQDGTRSWLSSYDATTGGYAPLRVAGSDVEIAINGAVVGAWGAGGLDLSLGNALTINGTRVVGARQTGTAANATDLASAIALVNDLKAKLTNHGLIS